MNTLSLILLVLISISCAHSYCTQNSDCEHGGECHNSKCECPVIRWAGEHCEVRTESYLGAKYTSYYYTVLVATWILFTGCAVKLWFVYKANRRHSMVHLAVWMLTIAMLRMLFVSDDFSLYQYSSRSELYYRSRWSLLS